MHQNAQIWELNFKNFPGPMPPDPHEGRGYGVPPQNSPRSALRRFAPTRLARGIRPLHRPPRTRNPASTPGRNHPLKILATPMPSVGLLITKPVKCNSRDAVQRNQKVDFTCISWFLSHPADKQVCAVTSPDLCSS